MVKKTLKVATQKKIKTILNHILDRTMFASKTFLRGNIYGKIHLNDLIFTRFCPMKEPKECTKDCHNFYGMKMFQLKSILVALGNR